MAQTRLAYQLEMRIRTDSLGEALAQHMLEPGALSDHCSLITLSLDQQFAQEGWPSFSVSPLLSLSLSLSLFLSPPSLIMLGL
jgi:hypothetical protein